MATALQQSRAATTDSMHLCVCLAGVCLRVSAFIPAETGDVYGVMTRDVWAFLCESSGISQTGDGLLGAGLSGQYC